MNTIFDYTSLLLPLKSPYCSIPVIVTCSIKNWSLRKACYWYLASIGKLILFDDDSTLSAFKRKHPNFSLRIDGVRYTAIDRNDVLTWMHRFGYSVDDRIGTGTRS